MSLPDSISNEPIDQPRGVLVRKPQTTIYSVLLLVALLALTVGCLLLVLLWARYDFQHRPPADFRVGLDVTAPLDIRLARGEVRWPTPIS